MAVEQGSTEEVPARYLVSQTLSGEKLQKAITDEGVTWTSSDDSVAAVDGDGQLTGIAPSTATITVSCADGKVTGSTELKEVITITGVDAPETLELVINGGDEMLLNAKMTPEAATDASLAFESSDDAIAYVDETCTLRAVFDGDSVIATTAVHDVFIYRHCERHHRL